MGHRPAKSSILRQYERARRPSLLGRVFRERHLYLRGENGVRFIVIRPWAQAAALGILLLFAFWTAYASVNTLFKSQMLALKDRKIASERRAHAARLERERAARARERAALQRTIRELNAKLMADQDAWLERVEEVRRDYERLLMRQERIRRRLKKTGLLDENAPPSGGTGALAARTHDGGKADPLHTASVSPVERSFRERFARPFRSAAEAEHVLGLLRAMEKKARARQIALLEQAAGKARARLIAARSIYRGLGIDPGRIRPARRAAKAVGGPFIPLKGRDADGAALAERMSRIEAILNETEALKRHAARLPFTAPMKRYTRISSRFGFRMDPFHHRLALHAGIDFKAAYGAPVLAAAPGVVTRAGWTGSYGRLVEIRHDNGVVTRYAHLSRVTVRTGQRVRRGQEIGKLGNTGRSTGPHLHYETRVNGSPINPELFWKAGNDLSKIKTRG